MMETRDLITARARQLLSVLPGHPALHPEGMDRDEGPQTNGQHRPGQWTEWAEGSEGSVVSGQGGQLVRVVVGGHMLMVGGAWLVGAG